MTRPPIFVRETEVQVPQHARRRNLPDGEPIAPSSTFALKGVETASDFDELPGNPIIPLQWLRPYCVLVAHEHGRLQNSVTQRLQPQLPPSFRTGFRKQRRSAMPAVE